MSDVSTNGCRFKRIETIWRWDGENRRHVLVGVPKSRSIHLLNPVGAAIFSLCDGSHTKEEIVSCIRSTFAGAEPARVENDVDSFLTYLLNLEVIHEA
jgi:hypothetical protein